MTSHPLDLFVRHLDSRARLGEEDRQAILGLPYSIEKLRTSEFALHAGEAHPSCVIILRGIAGRHRHSDGGRQIVSVHLPGEPANLQHLILENAEGGVQMLTAGTVAAIPCDALADLAMERPAISRAFFASVAAEASISREWLLNTGRRDGAQRLAHLMCELAVRLEAQGLSEQYREGLPLKHNQLSDILGLTPVHVGRILKQFAAKGLVSARKRPIAVSDWKQLRQLCAFDPAYLHLSKAKAGS